MSECKKCNGTKIVGKTVKDYLDYPKFIYVYCDCVDQSMLKYTIDGYKIETINKAIMVKTN